MILLQDKEKRMKSFREYLNEGKIEKELNEASHNLETGRREKVEDVLSSHPEILKIIKDNGFLPIIDRFQLSEKRFVFEVDEIDLTQEDMKKLSATKNKISVLGGSKPFTLKIIIRF
jgi:hypothetical protein